MGECRAAAVLLSYSRRTERLTALPARDGTTQSYYRSIREQVCGSALHVSPRGRSIMDYHSTWHYKQMARRDREAFLNKAASDTEEAASKGKMGDVFLAIRTVSGKTTSAVTAPIVKLDGSACSTTDEVLDRWCEHYESALNHPAGSVCH